MNKKITSCYQSCPFFMSTPDAMVCNHPYWEDKEPYSNMIITHENSRDGNIPPKCPLREQELDIKYTLDDDKLTPITPEELEKMGYKTRNGICMIDLDLRVNFPKTANWGKVEIWREDKWIKLTYVKYMKDLIPIINALTI